MKRYEIIFVSCLICICVGILSGCRSTKKVIEETTIQEVSESSADSTFNTAATTEKTTETRADSSNVRADERGRVEIERDSAGRPIVVIWNYDWHLQGTNTLQTEKGKWFNGLNTSYHSEASRKTDTDTKKKKETETEMDTSIPLEFRIGWTIVLLLIIFYTADAIWRKIKKSRQ